MRLSLCASMWQVFRKVAWAAEKNVYSFVCVECSAGIYWVSDLRCLLSSEFLNDLSTDDREVLKSPTVTVLWSISGLKI